MTTNHDHLHAPRPAPGGNRHADAATARAIVAHRNRRLRLHITRLLERDGFEVAQARSGNLVVSQLASWMLRDGTTADLVVCGAQLRGYGGLDLAAELPSTDWAPSVLVVLDAIESRQLSEAEVAQRAATPFVLRTPFQDEDLRTVAMFLVRSSRGPIPPVVGRGAELPRLGPPETRARTYRAAKATG